MVSETSQVERVLELIDLRRITSVLLGTDTKADILSERDMFSSISINLKTSSIPVSKFAERLQAMQETQKKVQDLKNKGK